MTRIKRRNHAPEFKAKVALAAAKGDKTLAELATKFDIHANQVWCTDITYIPMEKGFVYLIAVMDWYSRKVLSWRLSNTLDTDFCVEALEEAIAQYGCPEIFNTDQGCQFSSEKNIGLYLDFYNKQRTHQNLNKQTPDFTYDASLKQVA